MRPTSLTLSLCPSSLCPMTALRLSHYLLPAHTATLAIHRTHSAKKKLSRCLDVVHDFLCMSPRSHLNFPSPSAHGLVLAAQPRDAQICDSCYFFFHLSGESQLVKASYNKARLYLILRFHVCACITYSTGGPASPLLSGFPVKDFRVF